MTIKGNALPVSWTLIKLNTCQNLTISMLPNCFPYHSLLKNPEQTVTCQNQKPVLFFSIKLTCKNRTIIQTGEIGNSLNRVIEGQRVDFAQKRAVGVINKCLIYKRRSV